MRILHSVAGHTMPAFHRYRKVDSRSKSRSRSVAQLFKDFQTVYEGEISCFCTVTFGPKSLKLNSGPVYCSRLYGTLWRGLNQGRL